jgi:hypothetical protein
MKRLKPLLMAGTPHSSRTQAPAAAAIAAAIGEEGDAGEDGGATHADSPRPPPLPDPRVVRARALHLIRAVTTDNAQPSAAVAAAASAALVTSPDVASSTIVPVPQRVLDRLPAVAALIEHLCVTAVASRSEVRSHCAQVIVTLHALLPHSLRRAICRFLVKFMRTAKVINRVFAVEVAAQLLGVSVGSSTSGIAEPDKRSVAASDSIVLSALMRELRAPSAGDARFESAGYGEEAADYAGERGRGGGDT